MLILRVVAAVLTRGERTSPGPPHLPAWKYNLMICTRLYTRNVSGEHVPRTPCILAEVRPTPASPRAPLRHRFPPKRQNVVTKRPFLTLMRHRNRGELWRVLLFLCRKKKATSAVLDLTPGLNHPTVARAPFHLLGPLLAPAAVARRPRGRTRTQEISNHPIQRPPSIVFLPCSETKSIFPRTSFFLPRTKTRTFL